MPPRRRAPLKAVPNVPARRKVQEVKPVVQAPNDPRRIGVHVLEEQFTHYILDPDTREWTGETEEVMRLVPIDPDRRCTATYGPSNEWRGQRCVALSIRGGRVCMGHGGRLPDVRKAAHQRLLQAADPAAARLVHIALKKRNVEDKDRIRAITEILDRAGIQGKQTIELELKPWQELLQRLGGQLPSAEGDEDSAIQLVQGVDYEVHDEEEELDDLDD
jgi:hypothetical protein